MSGARGQGAYTDGGGKLSKKTVLLWLFMATILTGFWFYGTASNIGTQQRGVPVHHRRISGTSNRPIARLFYGTNKTPNSTSLLNECSHYTLNRTRQDNSTSTNETLCKVSVNASTAYSVRYNLNRLLIANGGFESAKNSPRAVKVVPRASGITHLELLANMSEPGYGWLKEETLASVQAQVDKQRNNSYFRRYREMAEFHSVKKNLSSSVIILIWTIRDYKYSLEGAAPFAGCAYQNCKVVKDKNQLPSSDLVFIFFDGHDGRAVSMPKVNPHKQVTLFQTRESEHWYGRHFLKEDAVFNYSMTYKSDSSIVFNYCQDPYFVSSNFHLPQNGVVAFSRSKTILWYVSNCGPKERLRYARTLSKYILVDIFGSCSRKSEGCKKGPSQGKCREDFFRQYPFYLSFENSRCKDYITEKLYKTFRYHTIPIVMGPPKSQYELVLPPGSFIHVDDFSGPEALAKHLKKIMGDPNLFMSYHAWRYTNFRFPDLCTVPHLETCELCRLANEKPQQKLKMSSFWNKGTNCRKNT